MNGVVSPAASGPQWATFIDVVRWRAQHLPTRRAFTYLDNGDQQVHITYAELDRRARAIAVTLRQIAAPGDRVLLLYGPGLEFVSAFFGCLYAGVVAVPTYPPVPTRLERTLTRLCAVIRDSGVIGILSHGPILTAVRPVLDMQQYPGHDPLTWIDSHAIDADCARRWSSPAIGAGDLAFLQYTSGSTSDPKGVMVSHANLLSNANIIHRNAEFTPRSVYVCWLPPYHDMGLIGGILLPIYGGFLGVLLSPLDFLYRPIRWLEAITQFRGCTSPFPNFALDLCVRKIPPDQREGLDLSSWSLACNGSEPIRTDTLARFSEAFGPQGFSHSTHYPAYGLAECTLLATGGKRDAPPKTIWVDGEALNRGRVERVAQRTPRSRSLVGCGSWAPDHELLIVDPDTGRQCPPDRVGEIWIAGPSVAVGYWNRPTLTRETFSARLGDRDGGPYLRTGDLGFVMENELYVTGRSNDLIIVAGRNLYPQDIERTASESHAFLRTNHCAAFAVEGRRAEQLVVVQELDKKATAPGSDFAAPAALAAIRRAVAKAHDVQPLAIVLVDTGSLPKTANGKLQRSATRDAWSTGALDEVARWTAPKDQEEILDWLVEEIAKRIGQPAETVDVNITLVDFGFGSLHLADMAETLERWLGYTVEPELFLRNPTVAQLTAELANGQPR
ncbi:MAG: AMP-binding protein [Proteobacteria bacterium]|nr:AMP-binding protein [Pseudomonadota bacterium]